MPKILSQAGISLADVYNVQGSVAGVDELDVNEVKAVHDLGPQIHSERTLGFIIRDTIGIAQNTAFGFFIEDFADSATRILGFSVLASVAGRLTHVSIAIRHAIGNVREMPIWVWDTADDVEKGIQWSDDGAAASAVIYLQVVGDVYLPTLLTRMGAERAMGGFSIRGLSSGFGAGTVDVFTLVHICRPNESLVPGAGEPSSHGLPIPSW